MITITDNAVLITSRDYHILQKSHPNTGKQFTSTEECFAWVVESGWFDRCKTEAIRTLKERSSTEILRKAPLFKQINAALGISTSKERQKIKNVIKNFRNDVNEQEKNFLKAKNLEEFLNLFAQNCSEQVVG